MPIKLPVSFVPQLQFGLFNAWLPILLYSLLTIILPFVINKDGLVRGENSSRMLNKDKSLMFISAFSFLGIAIFSIWVPLQAEPFFFVAGLSLYLTGLVLAAITSINFVTTPLDRPVVKGIYRFSRNPGYLTNYIMVLAVTLLSSAWMFIVLLIAHMVAMHFVILSEESQCRQKYGVEYQQYLKKVPRYFRFFV